MTKAASRKERPAISVFEPFLSKDDPAGHWWWSHPEDARVQFGDISGDLLGNEKRRAAADAFPTFRWRPSGHTVCGLYNIVRLFMEAVYGELHRSDRIENTCGMAACCNPSHWTYEPVLPLMVDYGATLRSVKDIQESARRQQALLPAFTRSIHRPDRLRKPSKREIADARRIKEQAEHRAKVDRVYAQAEVSRKTRLREERARKAREARAKKKQRKNKRRT